jgi:Flp pilus assembly protein TadB
MGPLALLGLAAAGGALGAVLVVWLPRWLEQRPASRVRRRLLALQRPDPDGIADAGTGPNLFERVRAGRLGRRWAELAEACTRLGGATVVRKLLLVGAAAAATTFVVLKLLGPVAASLTVVLMLAGAGAGALATWSFLLRRWQVAFLESFGDAIDLMTRAVRSGIPVTEAIRLAGREINEPGRSEFERIAHALDLGMDFKKALRRAARRVNIRDFDFLVVTLIIQRESGGQLGETLDGLSAILRRRKELRLKTRAITAEGRMSAAIVAAMPVLAGLGMYALDPDYIRVLLDTPTGRTLAYTGASCLALGMVVVRHMTRVRP